MSPDTVDPDQTVYFAASHKGGAARSFHTERDCRQLAKANKIHERQRRNVGTRKTLCAYCAGTREPGHDPSFDHLQSLKEAAEQ